MAGGTFAHFHIRFHREIYSIARLKLKIPRREMHITHMLILKGKGIATSQIHKNR